MHADNPQSGLRQPSSAEREFIRQSWAEGILDSDQIGRALGLSQSVVYRVLAEQQDARRFARKMGVVA